MSKKPQSKTTFNTNFSSSISLGKAVPKKEVNKTFVISILKDCHKYTGDTFWKRKLNEASLGIFPKFFSYKDGSLIYTIGKTKADTQYKELSQDPKISCEIFISFLKDKGKILSPSDTQNLVQIEEIPEESKPRIWAIYKKKDKEHMIDLYIEQMKKSLSLSDIESNELYRRILEGLNAGVFKGKSIKESKNMKSKTLKEIQDDEHIIVDSDNRILLIKGINFSSKSRKFTFDEKLEKQIRPKRSHKENVPINYKRSNNIISSRWKKYLEILDKNQKKQEPIIVNIEEDEVSDVDLF